MYHKFFGFRERPFQLVPNPAYLFLSKGHEEALAHLSYAVAQGDGFVEITGEVGTGKTTLCRVFLDNLNDDTIAAYIYNTKINSLQLLQSINDELGLKSATESTKELIDELNAFLIAKKTAGKKVVLIIDEAQNLECDVIEQLRLLSNLETNTSKLIQIVLVGQPELGEILDSYELRQMAQRITLHWHIAPMSDEETIEYINHRMHVASVKGVVKISRGAHRLIYQYSGGVPRLINIVCDRALLIAFGRNQRTVDSEITRAAIAEINRRKYAGTLKRRSERKWVYASLGAIGIALVVLAILVFLQFRAPAITAGTAKTFKIAPVMPAQVKATAKKQIQEKNVDFEQFLSDRSASATRENAIKLALRQWQVDIGVNPYFNEIEDDQTFFRVVANQYGFSLYGDWLDVNRLQLLNLPAIIPFVSGDRNTSHYLVLYRIDGDKYIFLHGGEAPETIEVTPETAVNYGSGLMVIPWRNFSNLTGIIPLTAPEDSIIMLKTLLKEIGFSGAQMNGNFGDGTGKYIRTIQEKYGISPDGIVDDVTKIALYNEKKSLAIPHLR
ncbi:MAG: AAA family ATPase [Desulfobacteraceae bacterium]|nr:AAA family ATPase [Desulfobacteraceae bacterium]